MFVDRKLSIRGDKYPDSILNDYLCGVCRGTISISSTDKAMAACEGCMKERTEKCTEVLSKFRNP